MEKISDDSLYSLMNNRLLKNGKKLDIADFITDDKKSAKFINETLREELLDLNKVDKYSIMNDSVTQGRARHVAVTYLLGMVMLPFVETVLKTREDLREFKRLWYRLALYHDFGYYSKHITNPNFNLKKDTKYFLLSDSYDVNELKCLNNFDFTNILAHGYDDILKYDIYARNYHKNKGDEELIDHGILGGCLVFDKKISKILSKGNYINREIIDCKKVCLVVSQHNIFKSNSKKTDKIYEEYNINYLKSDAGFNINNKFYLLLILSLVDTVECVKRFSKSQNSVGYLNTLTVLKNIEITFENNNRMMIIDYKKLTNYCFKNKNYAAIKNIENHLLNIKKLDTWTSFNAEINGNAVFITYKEDDNG